MPETHCGFSDEPGVASGVELLTLYGPTLQVDIGFDGTWKAGVTTPIAGIKKVNALVDTGASECCIDDTLAVQLNLPVIDKRPIGGIGGKHIANMYLAQIHVPSLNFTMYGAFAGVQLREGGQAHFALIGRTFLQHFNMIYEGTTGSVIISSPSPIITPKQ